MSDTQNGSGNSPPPQRVPLTLPGVYCHPEPIDELCRRILEGEREVVLTGAAGTGKTTLVREVLRRLREQRSFVQCAPTGRAARRLAEATGRSAQTVHSTFYYPPRETGEELIWQERKTIGELGHTVAVIDEASMVGMRLANDIRASLLPKGNGFRAEEQGPNTILWVGDPHQLGPVNDVPGVDLRQEGAIYLTKNWRSTNALIQFSQRILKAPGPWQLSSLLREYQSSAIHRIPRGGAPPGDWKAATIGAGTDSILITRANQTRHRLNARVRELLGRPADQIVVGDTLLVRTNHHGIGVLNGELLEVIEIIEEVPDLPSCMLMIQAMGSDGECRTFALMPSTFGTDTRKFRDAVREESLAWERYYRRGRAFEDERWREEGRRYMAGELDRMGQLFGPAAHVVHCDWGEALTAHGAQGGEWSNVGVVFGPGGDWSFFKNDFEEARAWWYTVVTRAKDALILWLDEEG